MASTTLALPALADFESALHGCRFCPMCKPASDVANVSANEGYSTRARGMFLWRKLHGFATYTPRYVELMYQSTLDSISEAWCVSHYPVSSYHLAARREVVAAGAAPAPVRAALDRPQLDAPATSASTLLVAGELAELGDPTWLERLTRLASRSDNATAVLATNTGHLAHALGDAAGAQTRARALADAIMRTGATTVVADGAATLFVLQKLLVESGAAFPASTKVLSLSEWLATLPRPARVSDRVFVHDARAAYPLTTRPPTAEVIKPEFAGPEDLLGTGSLYEAPRALCRALGADPVFSVWQRGLAKSSGADDGLWLTYPKMAALLAHQRLEHARSVGADTIVTESPLAAAWLRRHAAEGSGAPRVVWLPELWTN